MEKFLQGGIIKYLTKKLANKYDKIAKDYRNVSINIYATVEEIFMHQLNLNCNELATIKNIVDLGCGDGTLLKKLFDLSSSSSLFAIDISKEMLTLAANKCPMTTIQAAVEDAPSLLPRKYFDLILAHFIIGYVGIDKILEVAEALIKKNSYFSVATNTTGSFKNMREISCKHYTNILGYIIQKKVQNGIQHSKLSNFSECIEEKIKGYSMRIVDKQQLKIKLQFSDASELVDYILSGSWGIGEVNAYIPLGISKALFKFAMNHVCSFPFYDAAVIDVYLIKTQGVKINPMKLFSKLESFIVG